MGTVHPIFADLLYPFTPPREALVKEHTVVAHDLQPGDELLDTVIGGWSGRIYSVHIDEVRDRVRVIFEAPGRSAELGFWEICQVARQNRDEGPEAA